jgi:hypothetical protein
MSTERSSWAVGYAWFAAVILMMAGCFHIIAGVAGVLEDDFYAVTPNWIFEFDSTVWGWIHLIGGVLVVVAGFSILKGHMYGRVIGTAAAAVSAIANFMWLPYQPWWSILIIALDIAVIWALTAHGRDVATRP